MMNIMNPPADWSTLKKLIWLRGTPITGGEELTVSGTPPLSLPNSLGKPLKAWEVDVLPYQNLHGYDNPWPAGGGKNKFFHGTELSGQYIQQTGIVASADGWKVSDYIPVLPNTQYTFNPNTTGGNSAYAAFYNESKSKKGATIPSGKQTFTTYEGTAYMRFSFRATSEDIQLELGSTDTAFAPYSNLCPIHGTDKVTITTAGKNLCSSKLYQNSSTAIYVGQDNATDYTFALIAGQTYTISAVSTISPDVYLREENERQGVLWGNGLPKSFTPSVTGNYRIALAKGEGISVDDFSDVQVEFGSTATPYTPYLAPSQTVLTLPQTVYTGTIGSDGGESRWGEVDLGTLTWTYMTRRTNPYFMAIIPEMKSVSSNAGNTNVMCEGFTRYVGTVLFNTADLNSGFNCTSWEMGSNNHNVAIVWKDYTTVTDFTTAVTGMKLIFELTEPTQFPLTAPTIHTPTGTATTWATAEDGTVESMEVTYVGKA